MQPKIITLEMYELSRLRPRDLELAKAIHNTVHRLEREDGLVHPFWPFCECRTAQEIRKREQRELAMNSTNPSVIQEARCETLSFEEWKEAYNTPETIRDEFNRLFCEPARPVVDLSAEELNEKRFFLEQMMSYVKIAYKKVCDLESAKLDALDETSRIQLRAKDAARRAMPAKENTGRAVRLTTEEKAAQSLSKLLGIRGTAAQKKLADLIDDIDA